MSWRVDARDLAHTPQLADRACSATMMPASVPDTPTPMLPWAFMASTSCWFTSPVSTMRTRSMASSVVTRWPSTNSTGRSNLAKARLMALPPPWTSTGFTPENLQKHDVGHDLGGQLGVLHGRAAVLDDDGLARHLLEPRHGLVEDLAGAYGYALGTGFVSVFHER